MNKIASQQHDTATCPDCKAGFKKPNGGHYTKEEMERVADFVQHGQKLMNLLNVNFLSVSADKVPIFESTITKFDARELEV